jgi:hypothetical protein
LKAGGSGNQNASIFSSNTLKTVFLGGKGT